MKRMKKMIALLVAMVMVLGMSMSVMAASITITHDEDTYDPGSASTARVYEAYKIFDAVYEDGLAGENTQDDKDAFSYDPEDAAVAYTMATDSPWVDAMTDAAQTWFDVKLSADGSVYVVTATDSYASSADAKDFADYLLENMPDDADATEVTVDGDAAEVDPGYYLIVAKDTKDGVTRLALVTTDVEMVEKNTYITVGKTTARTSYSVGDLIEYTVTVTIPSDTALTIADGEGYKDGHGPIILHDVLDSRLTFQGEMKSASIGDDAYELVWTEDTSAVNHTTNQADGCTFELIIPVTADLLGETVTFTYEAEVNSSAATDTGLVNELGGEINGYKTVPEEPEVYTFDFDFIKLFDDEEDEELTATFELRTTAGDESTAISFIKDSDGNYIKADSDDEGAETTITMTNGEQLNFLGFEAGTYYLVELTTSIGYNLLDGPVTVTITDTSTETSISHEVTYIVNGEEAEGVVTVENHSGTVLPSTGGIGTTIFYVVGALLIVGAGVVLVTRRRMNVQ